METQNIQSDTAVISDNEQTAVQMQTSTAQPNLAVSKVKTNFHLIIQPTKIFSEADPQRATVNSNGFPIMLDLYEPFEVSNIAAPNGTTQKLFGFFRYTLFPALRLVTELNNQSILRLGGLRDTEQTYKEIALNLKSKIDAVMPDISGYCTKSVVVSKPQQGSFEWSIDVFCFYVYRGALVEDVTGNFDKIAKGLEKDNLQCSLSLAVALEEARSLVGNSELLNYEFSTSAESKVLPQTKVARKTLLGQSPTCSDEVTPLVICTRN